MRNRDVASHNSIGRRSSCARGSSLRSDSDQATVLVLADHARTVVKAHTDDGVQSLPQTTAAKVTQKSSRTLIESPLSPELESINRHSSSSKRA